MAADGVVPDVRDGLTPICRRALEALGRELRDSTQVVDAALRRARRRDGGRRAIYGELVRMAREWELRHPLVAAEGNLGSLNGDGAASPEYTRMRLAPAGADALHARLPNLLANGSFSLATGPASSIPPHNVREVAGAAIAFIDDPAIDVDGLMRHLTGPDFPTGGIVVAGEGLRAAYETGRGEIAVRARAHVEPSARGDAIVVSELPFMVSTGGKGGVLGEIARAAKAGRIDGVAAIDDLSDERDGLRIVITLTPGAPGDRVLAQLFAHTRLERPYRLAFVAAAGGTARTMSLRDLVACHVEQRLAQLGGAQLVRDELLEIAELHGDDRRTTVR